MGQMIIDARYQDQLHHANLKPGQIHDSFL
jgi:hypothetical protein